MVFSFILVLENKRDCSPHKSALSCFCYMFSMPRLGLLCHFLSPVVFVVSLYLILLHLLASCIYTGASKKKIEYCEKVIYFKK